MDGETQQHLHLGQDAVPNSTGSESTTPGAEVNSDLAEATRRLEQSHTLPIQSNKGARPSVEDVAASPATNETFGSVAYDAVKELCSFIAARCKDIPTTLANTIVKKVCDVLITFAISYSFGLLQKVDLASADALMSCALRMPWKTIHIVDSFLAARYPWWKLFIETCCYIILATLPYVLIIWIHSGSHLMGVPDALGRRSLLMIALVLIPWIVWTAVMLEVPAPKVN